MKKFDKWLAFSVALYVANLMFWLIIAIRLIWAGVSNV